MSNIGQYISTGTITDYQEAVSNITLSQLSDSKLTLTLSDNEAFSSDNIYCLVITAGSYSVTEDNSTTTAYESFSSFCLYDAEEEESQTITNDEISYSNITYLTFQPNLDDYTKITIRGDFQETTGCTAVLYILKNVIGNGITPTSLIKIGIWGSIGQKFCLNGEQMRLGQNGVYELYNKNISIGDIRIIPLIYTTDEGKEAMKTVVIDYLY